MTTWSYAGRPAAREGTAASSASAEAETIPRKQHVHHMPAPLWEVKRPSRKLNNGRGRDEREKTGLCDLEESIRQGDVPPSPHPSPPGVPVGEGVIQLRRRGELAIEGQARPHVLGGGLAHRAENGGVGQELCGPGYKSGAIDRYGAAGDAFDDHLGRAARSP